MESPTLQRMQPSAALSIWHDYRTTVILSTLVVLFAVRAWLHLRRKKDVSCLPPSPRSLPIVPEKLPLPETLPAEEKKNVVASRPPKGPRRVTGRKPVKGASPLQNDSEELLIQPHIFFFSLGGSTTKYAGDLHSRLCARPQPVLEPQLHDLTEVDFDDFFLKSPSSPDSRNIRPFYCLVLPSYNIDTLLNTFLEHLSETHHDFRIDTAPLSSLAGYSVFGIGDREEWPTEQEGFCSQAVEVDKWMAKLTGRKRAYPLGMGDVKSNFKQSLHEWASGLEDVICDIAAQRSLGEGVAGSGDPLESDDEDIAEDSESEFPNPPPKRARKQPLKRVDDLEDLGGLARSSDTTASTNEPPAASPLAIDFTTYSSPKKAPSPPNTDPKPMVPTTSPTYTALTKQGYSIIGTHSGVKICRWTKSALRGRGSCYKYSFYGIRSHLCMETTPSLSCSNKCVFCWRHGTNPVGTSWRWQVDPPDMIFNGVKEAHYKKIKMMKGVPGVRAERFAEAMRIRHCALSLVGEPIFYPHINEFTAMLHAERISSFLVCNAQHPAQLAALKPVTQLYVSIDASNRDSLRKIDRPLHRDFWERFQACLDILREHRFRQRTVFRLTLVKGFNVEDEAEGYADLVAKGLPCFVEVKGVTYCGTSSSAGAGLTMQNVPFYEEVCAFVQALDAALARRGLEYGIAAEHAHSCCILIASKRFFIDDKWHTLIDYEKFFQCLESGKEFGPEDYIGEPTPEWATWGNGGFNPEDERVRKKGKNRDRKEAVEAKPSVD